MVRNNCTEKPVPFRKLYPLVLAFFSCASFSFGVYTASISGPAVFSLVRSAVSGQVSIMRMVLVVVLPFLVSAVAVLLSKAFLLLFLILLKSCFYGFFIYAVCVEFPNAGWLVCMLLLFTDAAVLLCTHFFALRHRWSFSDSAVKELLLLFVLCLGVGFLDATVISPFLTMLLTS